MIAVLVGTVGVMCVLLGGLWGALATMDAEKIADEALKLSGKFNQTLKACQQNCKDWAEIVDELRGDIDNWRELARDQRTMILRMSRQIDGLENKIRLQEMIMAIDSEIEKRQTEEIDLLKEMAARAKDVRGN